MPRREGGALPPGRDHSDGRDLMPRKWTDPLVTQTRDCIEFGRLPISAMPPGGVAMRNKCTMSATWGGRV